MSGSLLKIRKNKTGNLLEKGVTFIELIIAISVIGILAAFALNSLEFVKTNAKLKATQAEVSTAIKTAQSYALGGKEQSGQVVCGYGFRFRDTTAYEIFYNRLNGAFVNCEEQNENVNFRRWISGESNVSAGDSFSLPSGVVLANPTEGDTRIFFDLPHANVFNRNGNPFSPVTFIFESPPSSGNRVSINISSRADIVEN